MYFECNARTPRFAAHAHGFPQPRGLILLDARPVCLFGANGAGKTNILEALTMLAPGRPAECIVTDVARAARTTNSAAVGGVGAHQNDGEETNVGWANAHRRRRQTHHLPRWPARDSCDPPKHAHDLAHMAMDRLWSAPRDRRRFFDRLTARASQHGAAAAYERAMRERQRSLSERSFDDVWLGGLEREMSAHGAAIAAARVETLHRLQEAIDARPDGAFPKAVLALEGLLEQRFENGSKSADVEEDFAELLRDVRGRDAGAGRALDGPHRSDLKARNAAKNMDADQCSTGEQRRYCWLNARPSPRPGRRSWRRRIAYLDRRGCSASGFGAPRSLVR